MKRRCLLLVLFLGLVFMLVPLTGLAAEEGTGSDIELSDYELLLYPSDYDKKITLQGDYELSNIKYVEAYSDNADVATITWNDYDNYGTIYTDKMGTADITIKVYEEYTDEYDWVTTLNCKVVVAKKPKFEYSKYYVAPDGASGKPIIKNAPKGIKPMWYSSNKKVATVNKNGKVTPRGVGTCKIYAKYAQKTISCKCIIKWYPNYRAIIIKIDKKKKIVKVKIKNQGKKPLVIKNRYATLWYKNGKQSRVLKAKNKKIKPGKTVTITYKAKGKKLKGSMKGAFIYHEVTSAGSTYNIWTDLKIKLSTLEIGGSYYKTYYRKRY